jgi:hypothetical protein
VIRKTPRPPKEAPITVCIGYTLDAAKLAEFEAYAGLDRARRALRRPDRRLLPAHQFAGPTNFALALIDFPSLAAYEQYRAKLAADPGHTAVAQRAAKSGCILVEDRSFLARVG